MRKLDLAALSYDRDAVLNALERTNAVEVREHAELEGTQPLPEEGEELRAYLAALEETLATLSSYAPEKSIPKDGFDVSYLEFSQAGSLRAEMDELTATARQLTQSVADSAATALHLEREIAAMQPYAALPLAFDAYADTPHTRTRLGLFSRLGWEECRPQLEALPLTAYEAWEGEEQTVVAVTCHRSVFAETDELLGRTGFTPCPHHGGERGVDRLAGLHAALEEAKRGGEEATATLRTLTEKIRSLKIYCDYVAFQLEKAETAKKLRGTERTFFLEAFVPADEEERVKTALEGTMSAIWYDFSDPGEDEAIPTLLENNPVVKNFEVITNMYSAPSARELDPNTVMSFFFSLFIGFIMGDIGYGLLMLLGGGILWKKNREGGMKSLSGVFAVGGIFSILWGVLFNSLFGIKILPFTVMPDAQTEMYNFAGISLPGVLVISLLIGVIQLMAGYLCRAALCFHRGHVWDGILDGGVWALFSLGMELAMMGLVEEFGLSFLLPVGGGLAGLSLVVAVVTAGRKEKFLGKLTKGFGALYSLINYFTDVLSYIRLYGLMLTGAVIAQVVSDYSLQFLTSGSALIILGPILMVIGHVFNLAIGLLGAYIHTARLQYVEFFGRFYEGEGELFTPLGSQKKYITLEKAPREEQGRKNNKKHHRNLLEVNNHV